MYRLIKKFTSPDFKFIHTNYTTYRPKQIIWKEACEQLYEIRLHIGTWGRLEHNEQGCDTVGQQTFAGVSKKPSTPIDALTYVKLIRVDLVCNISQLSIFLKTKISKLH